MNFLVAGLAVIGLGATFGSQAGRSSYSVAVSIGLTTMAMAEAAITWAVARGPLPLVWALVAFAIAISGVSFAQRGTARDVLMVGGSLAGVQGITPMGGLLAAFLIPILVQLPKPPDTGPRQANVYLLLFFLPVLAAFGLAYLARGAHADPLSVIRVLNRASLPFGAVPSRPIRLALIAANTTMAAPALALTLLRPERRTVHGLFPLLVGLAFIAAECVATLSGTIRNPALLAAPLAAMSLLAVLQWPRPHTAHALAAVGGGVVLGAIYALIAVPYVWTM